MGLVAAGRTAQPVAAASATNVGQRTHWYLKLCAATPAESHVPGLTVRVEASVRVPVTVGAAVLTGVGITGPTALEKFAVAPSALDATTLERTFAPASAAVRV